jgi:two-component system, OmpR family, response regulator ResD
MPKKYKILVAEDDPFLIKIMGNRLKEEGFIVDLANDGNEALDKIDEDGYSVVLLDLVMPNKDGFEVLTELKKRKSKTPIIVFSNLSQEEDKQEVLKLGAKGFFVKSDIAIDKVVETVRAFLSK